METQEDVLGRCVWKPRRIELMAGVTIRNLTLGNDHTVLLADDKRLYRFAGHLVSPFVRAVALPCLTTAVVGIKLPVKEQEFLIDDCTINFISFIFIC